MSTLIKGSSPETVFEFSSPADFTRINNGLVQYGLFASLNFADFDYVQIPGSVTLVEDDRAYIFVDSSGNLNLRARVINSDGANVTVTENLGAVPASIDLFFSFDSGTIRFFADGVLLTEESGYTSMRDAVNAVPSIEGMSLAGADYLLNDYATFDNSLPTVQNLLDYSAGNAGISDFDAAPLHAHSATGSGEIITQIPATFGTQTFEQTQGATSGAFAPVAVSSTFKLNDAPTVTQSDSANTDEDTAITVDVLANDSDADDVLSIVSYTIDNDATVYDASEVATVDNVGAFSVSSAGITFTPAQNYDGAVPVVTYTTNTGATDTLTITINPIVDPPATTAGFTRLAVARPAALQNSNYFASLGIELVENMEIEVQGGEAQVRAKSIFDPVDNGFVDFTASAIANVWSQSNSELVWISANYDVPVSQIDNTPPVITLNGGDITLNVGDTYTELGATALDNNDGDLTSSISITGTIDTSSAGVQALAYSVVDAAGNAAVPVVRTVTIQQAQAQAQPQPSEELAIFPTPVRRYKQVSGRWFKAKD